MRPSIWLFRGGLEAALFPPVFGRSNIQNPFYERTSQQSRRMQHDDEYNDAIC